MLRFKSIRATSAHSALAGMLFGRSADQGANGSRQQTRTITTMTAMRGQDDDRTASARQQHQHGDRSDRFGGQAKMQQQQHQQHQSGTTTTIADMIDHGLSVAKSAFRRLANLMSMPQQQPVLSHVSG